MAEFKCYECGKMVKTGEKFTFTKKGSVHFECFISSRRKEVAPENQETLRSLTILLDKELQHLISVLDIKEVPESLKETIRLKYKDIEKACGETTRIISDLQ
jgi:hypothetical protein